MKNWKTDSLILVFAAIALTCAFMSGRSCGHQSLPSCGVADSYGYHDNTDAQKSITCPDKRQELSIERKGVFMGVFEYRCHCQ